MPGSSVEADATQLRQRIAELEALLAEQQAELVTLREGASLADRNSPATTPDVGHDRHLFFQWLSEISPIGLAWTDENHQCVYANKEALRIAGLKPDQIASHHWLAAIHPDDREWIVAEWANTIGKRAKYSVEYRFLRPDGSITWVENQAVPRIDAQGNVLGAIGAMIDITPRKSIEAKLRDSHDWLHTLAATVPAIISVNDAHSGRFTFVSQGLQTVLGYPSRQLLEGGSAWLDSITDPSDAFRVKQQQEQLAASCDSTVEAPSFKRSSEYRVRHANGSWHWMQAISSVFSRHADGSPAEWLTVMIDITAQREKEEYLINQQQVLEHRVAERTRQYALANKELRYEISQRQATEYLLSEQNKLLESVLHGISTGVIVLDERGHLTLVNRSAGAMLRLPERGVAADVVGTNTVKLSSAAVSLPSAIPWRRVLHGETLRDLEVCVPQGLADGTDLWLNVSGDPLWNEEHSMYGAVLLLHDDTNRRQTRAALNETVERFNLMVDGSKIGLWDAWAVQGDPLNLQNKIHYSKHLIELLGYSSEEFGDTLGSWARCVHPDDSLRVFGALEEHLFRQAPFDIEYRCLTKQGELKWFSARGDSIRGPSGNSVRMSGSFIDITARKNAEEKLRQEQDFLRGLMEVHERDRQIMAYDIHDGLIQYITSAAWQLESHASNNRGTQSGTGEFNDILDALRHAINDGRRVLSGLRPPVLDEAGIVVGLEYLIAEQQSLSTADVRLTHHVAFKRLPPLLEGTIYRIVQEALTNMHKHSRAAQADVVLVQLGDDSVRLTIRDNGRGFVLGEVSPKRFGLQGIRKRAALSGGIAEIESTPGHGTVVSVTLPTTISESNVAAKS